MSCLLSIVIPVYNVEKYIARCLESIYNQNRDLFTFEVIIVNDGTPDNSMQIVDEYCKKYKSIFVVNQENQGLSVARNVGLSKASGEYVWFVDSDDWLTGNAFDILYEYIKQKPALISSPLIASFDDEKLNWNQFQVDSSKVVSSAEYLVRYPVGAVQRYIMKRTILIDNDLNFFPGIYHEDAEFAPRLLYKSEKVLFIKEPLYHYYQRIGSIMSSWKTKNTQDYLFVASRINGWRNNVENLQFKSALDVFVMKILFRAFPYNQIMVNSDIKCLFLASKNLLRKKAVKVLFSKRVSLKFRILSFMAFFSPKFSLYMLQKKEK